MAPTLRTLPSRALPAIAAVAAALLLAPASIASATTFAGYSGRNVAIPDGRGRAVTTIHFAGVPPDSTASAVRPNFIVRHKRTHDLKLYVKGPDGTRVLLDDRQTHGRNLGQGPCINEDPLFNSWMGFSEDRASNNPQPLSSGSPPYVGYWLPDHHLTPLVGEPLGGTWKLIVKDVHRNGVGGQISCAALFNDD